MIGTLPEYSDSMPESIANFGCIVHDIHFARAQIVSEM